jgi:hypothetical protein
VSAVAVRSNVTTLWLARLIDYSNNGERGAEEMGQCNLQF